MTICYELLIKREILFQGDLNTFLIFFSILQSIFSNSKNKGYLHFLYKSFIEVSFFFASKASKFISASTSPCAHAGGCWGGLGGTESCAEESVTPLPPTSHTCHRTVTSLTTQRSLQDLVTVCSLGEDWEGRVPDVGLGHKKIVSWRLRWKEQVVHRPLSQTPAAQLMETRASWDWGLHFLQETALLSWILTNSPSTIKYRKQYNSVLIH